jgi:hypothetical protein
MMRTVLRRSFVAAAIAPILSAALSRPGFTAPGARLWEKWVANDPSSQTVVGQEGWAEFLGRYLVQEPDGINRLRYGEVSTADREGLARHLDRASRVAVSRLNRTEQFAYWINLYNALTVKVVLEHYPVASIREVTLGTSLVPRFITGGSGPWSAKLVQIEGEDIALDDIEHRILRPLMRDDRVHYAVNCASIGCPTLLPVPFAASRLAEMLDHGARLFVNHPRGVRRDGDGLTVSSLYRWYQEDFGGDWAGVLAHLRQYAGPATQQLLAGIGTVANDAYDWRLNDAGSYLRTVQAPPRI